METPELDNNSRKNLIQKLIKVIENDIDEKVFVWMKTKQTRFKKYEKDQIQIFNNEFIVFLNSLRVIDRKPINFIERVEAIYIGNKIIHLNETINSLIY